MNTRYAVLIATGLLVSFTASVHLVLGIGGAASWLRGGDFEPLVPLFLLSSLALFGAMYAFARGLVAPTMTYLFVAGVTSTYLVGYADYHAVGFVESALGIDSGHSHDGHGHTDDGHDHTDDGHGHSQAGHGHTDDGHGHSHDGTASEVLLDHLRADTAALSTKVAELLATGSLIALAVTEE